MENTASVRSHILKSGGDNSEPINEIIIVENIHSFVCYTAFNTTVLGL